MDDNGNYASGIGQGAAGGATTGMAFGPYGAIVGAGIGALYGGYQTYAATKALQELEKQKKANYTVSPELQSAYNRAQEMSSRGFTPTETATFNNNLASQTNAAQYNAKTQMGNNLAGSVYAGINAQNLAAQNKFSADDAGLRRENIKYADSIGQAIQQEKNLGTGVDVQNQLLLQQAYGGGLKAGSENLVGGLKEGAAWMGYRNPYQGIRHQAYSAGGYDPRPEGYGTITSSNPNYGVDLTPGQLDYRNNTYGY